MPDFPDFISGLCYLSGLTIAIQIPHGVTNVFVRKVSRRNKPFSNDAFDDFMLRECLLFFMRQSILHVSEYIIFILHITSDWQHTDQESSVCGLFSY